MGRDAEKKRLYMREYFARNREVLLQKQRVYHATYKRSAASVRKQREWDRSDAGKLSHKLSRDSKRTRILAAYGNKCACCGESEKHFLAIDHKNNNGSEERGKFGNSSSFYAHIIKSGFPDCYQLLCHNCNQAKGYYGMCPHERSRN